MAGLQTAFDLMFARDGKPLDWKQALQLLRPLADSGDSIAAMIVGYCMYCEIFLPMDRDGARVYLAKSSHPLALFALIRHPRDGETRTMEDLAAIIENWPDQQDSFLDVARGRCLMRLDPEANLESATAAYESASARGNLLGDVQLLCFHISENHIEQSYLYAERLAQQGDVRSQYTCAELLNADMHQPERAIVWYERAAAQGFGRAMSALGELYRVGCATVPADESLARQWLERAVQLCATTANSEPNPAAHFELAKILRRSALPDELTRAVALYEIAASSGHLNAQANVARCYMRGEGVAVDTDRALHWWEQAAQQGDVECQLRVADIFREGKVTTADPALAHYWYERASQAGSPRADYYCALHLFGVQGRVQQAFTQMQRSATAGFMPAMRELGIMYEMGDHSDPDYAQAQHWYEQAIEHGSVLAKLDLGHLFARSASTYEQAKQIFTALAESDLNTAPEAMCALGDLAVKTHSPAEARSWYERAMARGDANGYWALGCVLLDGQGGFVKNEDEGEMLIAYAARLGLKIAQRELWNLGIWTPC